MTKISCKICTGYFFSVPLRKISKRMRIIDEIKKRFFRQSEVIFWRNGRPYFDGWGFCRHKFAEVIWYNICDILTDLIEDVQISNAAPTPENSVRFAAFKSFVYVYGKQVLQRLFDEGFVVIGYDPNIGVFWQMSDAEYVKVGEREAVLAKPVNENVKTYVMKSSTFLTYCKSDLSMCKGFLDYLNDVLNGSATVSKRLGAVVVASPKNLTGSPTAVVLSDEQKKKMENDMRDDYGALSEQSNIMLLPREMNWQVINLAGLELRLQEKVKTAILAIVDRVKIPANQVAIIDAQTNKQMANGSEIREGDKLKYKTFRRLFERTFVDMARSYALRISYAIDGEPVGENSEVSVQPVS